MDNVLGLLGMLLLFGLPLGFAIYLYRRAKKKQTESSIQVERKLFTPFLIATIAAGLIILVGILTKSDGVFVLGFAIFGIVALIRGYVFISKIKNQEEQNDNDGLS